MDKESLYEIVIRYDKETWGMTVTINGKPVENIHKIKIEAEDLRPPVSYECVMCMPEGNYK